MAPSPHNIIGSDIPAAIVLRAGNPGFSVMVVSKEKQDLQDVLKTTMRLCKCQKRNHALAHGIGLANDPST